MLISSCAGCFFLELWKESSQQQQPVTTIEVHNDKTNIYGKGHE